MPTNIYQSNPNINNRPVLDEERNDSTPMLPIAFLVEDRKDEVIIATHLEPALPWWKQSLQRYSLHTLIFLLLYLPLLLQW